MTHKQTLQNLTESPPPGTAERVLVSSLRWHALGSRPPYDATLNP